MQASIELLLSKNIDPSNNHLKQMGCVKKALIACKKRHPEWKEEEEPKPAVTSVTTTTSTEPTTTPVMPQSTTSKTQKESDEMDFLHVYPLESGTKVISPQPNS